MSTEGGDVPHYFRGMNTNATLNSADLMALEDAHGAHNYHPLPVADRGEQCMFGMSRENNTSIS